MNTKTTWNTRYQNGGDSGLGTHHELLHKFKIDYINSVISKYKLSCVYDIGCGDGHQMKDLDDKVSYIGTDISNVAIDMCKLKYKNKNKSFIYYDETSNCADINISLDVIYHILEEDVYNEYMNRLFTTNYVLIYSSDHDSVKNGHVFHRKFTDDVPNNYKLIEKVENPYKNLSSADFYLYIK